VAVAVAVAGDELLVLEITQVNSSPNTDTVHDVMISSW
jgi:hypothetical protein